MRSPGTSLERDHAYKEAFLASLSNSIAIATADWPTMRYWTKASLNRLFKKVRADLQEHGRPHSNVELLNWLKKLGLAWDIEAEGETFYLLEMGASPRSEVDPLELMMAYEPLGVVCYFSAVAYHSLTTQIPSHHHAATLTDSARRADSDETGEQHTGDRLRQETIANKADKNTKTRKKANPLGKLAFSYLDTPYYLTRRKKRLVPGMQNRSNGPRGRFCITTYEQTLLDTLHKPQNCGGPAVVLEAWQEATASGRLDEERMLSYLTRMDYPSTTRRLGAMLQLVDYTPEGQLKSYLDQARRNLDRRAPYAQISLLPGFDYANLNIEWLVKLP
jgi:hypothetical protein